jgi:hypothetical protein
MRRLAVLVSLTSLAAGAASAADAQAERMRSEALMRRAFDMRPSPDAVRTPRTVARPARPAAPGTTEDHSGGRLLWEDRYDGSPYEQVFSSATLRGKVYSAGYVWTPAGRDFLVRVVDARTGALEWQDQVDTGDDEFASGVATDGQRVFVSGDMYRAETDYDWVLRAYDPDTGERLWETTFDLVGRSDFCRGTAIATGAGLVYLGGYATSEDDQGDFNTDWIVRAYDAETGALVWQDHTETFSGAYSLMYERGRLFVGGWTRDNTNEIALVRALDARTGRRLWQRGSPGSSQAAGATWTKVVKAEGGRVFAGQSIIEDGWVVAPRVQAYDERTGHLLWSRTIDTGPQDGLYDLDVSGSRVTAVGFGGPRCTFGATSDCDAIVRTYGAAHGDLLWQRQVDIAGFDDQAHLVTSSPQAVFVHSAAGPITQLLGCCDIGQWTVSAFHPQTGELLWQALGEDGESGVYNMPLDHGRLFIPGRAVDSATGEWDTIVRAYDARGRGEVLFPLRRQVAGAGSSGHASYRVALGGSVATAAHGAVPAKRHNGVVADDPTNDVWTALSTGVGVSIHTLTVPPGTRALRVGLFNEETDGAHDLDLFLFRSGFGLVATSAWIDSNEGLTLMAPTPGTYRVVVHGYETQGPEAHYTLSTWSLGDSPSANLSVAGPTPNGTVDVSWSGLDPGRYLGAVSYSNPSGAIGQTLVSVRVEE